MRHALVSMARLGAGGGARRARRGRDPAVGASAGIRSSRGSEAASFRRFEEELAAFDFRPNRGAVFSAHQMGSARMGASIRDHACDPWGRVRRRRDRGDATIGGLYVGDGSLFPTGIGVNPMITIMALARRVARTVLAETPGS